MSFNFVQGVLHSNCTFPTSCTGILGAVYMLEGGTPVSSHSESQQGGLGKRAHSNWRMLLW